MNTRYYLAVGACIVVVFRQTVWVVLGVALATFGPSARGALVTYEVLGTVGEVFNPNQENIVGQSFRVVFSYETTSLAILPDNTDGDEFLAAYASGAIFLAGESISLFSDLKLGRRPAQPPGGDPGGLLNIWLGSSGGGREPSIFGVIPNLAIYSLISFRPDGRLLPPSGELFSTSELDSLLTSYNPGFENPPIFNSTLGDLIVREVVPEPSIAVLSLLGVLIGISRRRVMPVTGRPHCIPHLSSRNSNADETANNGAAENCSARHGSCYSYSGVSRSVVALFHVRCLPLRSTLAATAPRSAVSELESLAVSSRLVIRGALSLTFR